MYNIALFSTGFCKLLLKIILDLFQSFLVQYYMKVTEKDRKVLKCTERVQKFSEIFVLNYVVFIYESNISETLH